MPRSRGVAGDRGDEKPVRHHAEILVALRGASDLAVDGEVDEARPREHCVL